MIEIRPGCVQNIKQNLSKQKFAVINRYTESPANLTSPVFKPVKKKSEMSEIMKFFLKSFNHSAGAAGTADKKNFFDNMMELFAQKTWALIEKYRICSKNTVVEIVKDNDKVLGCYSLSLKKKKNNAYINFLAINPDIKDSKMAVKTLLNMASRMSEKTRSKNIDTLSWTTDKRNKKAFRLFDKFPADKRPKGVETEFSINISDFDATLNKYM